MVSFNNVSREYFGGIYTIIEAVEVFDIHILKNAVVTMNPSNSSLGRGPTHKSSLIHSIISGIELTCTLKRFFCEDSNVPLH